MTAIKHGLELNVLRKIKNIIMGNASHAIKRRKESQEEKMRMNRVAQFEKVSFEQFLGDYIDIFGLKPEAYEIETIRQIYNGIKIPVRATQGSAGYDFKCPVDIELETSQSIKIPTGIRCRMEDGWVLMLCPRSSLGFRYRMQLDNTVGIIDGDYFGSDNEGHIIAKVSNGSNDGRRIYIKGGDNFIQGIFLQYGVTVDDSVCGKRDGGIGSTGR